MCEQVGKLQAYVSNTFSSHFCGVQKCNIIAESYIRTFSKVYVLLEYLNNVFEQTPLV